MVLVMCFLLFLCVWGLLRRIEALEFTIRNRNNWQCKCEHKYLEDLAKSKQEREEAERKVREHTRRLDLLSADPKRSKGGGIRAEDDAELDRQEGRPPQVYHQRTRKELGLVSAEASTSPETFNVLEVNLSEAYITEGAKEAIERYLANKE